MRIVSRAQEHVKINLVAPSLLVSYFLKFLEQIEMCPTFFLRLILGNLRAEARVNVRKVSLSI
jgi:hypothetical protein